MNLLFIRELLVLNDKDGIRELIDFEPTSNYELFMEDQYIGTDYIIWTTQVSSNFISIISRVQFQVFSGVTLELIKHINSSPQKISIILP